uniref:Uncharacterized protein n=1 Tax=Lepeophtheirus salmonis TaxID=72036 RepID=A0A0K2UCR8_LEPSM
MWPSSSSNLKPLDFAVWSFLEQNVCHTSYPKLDWLRDTSAQYGTLKTRPLSSKAANVHRRVEVVIIFESFIRWSSDEKRSPLSPLHTSPPRRSSNKSSATARPSTTLKSAWKLARTLSDAVEVRENKKCIRRDARGLPWPT